MSTSEDSLWKIIKSACKQCFKTETSSQAGRINALFGLLIFGLIVVSITTPLIDKLLSCFFEVELSFPWYVFLICFILFIIYSGYCVYKLQKIEELKNQMKNIHKK